MKNYFTKYLPVEGQTKTIHYCEGCNRADMLHCAHADYCGNVLSKEVQVTKLFLCSRDIQVGDIVKTRYYEGLKDFHCGNEGARQAAINNGSFKIIGEISPRAKWVKEGVEFSEEDLEMCYVTPDGKFIAQRHVSGEKKLPVGVRIKGPCGHFH